MRHFHCALLTALAFPVATDLINPLGFDYLFAYPAFTCGFAVVLGWNAAVGCYLSQLAVVCVRLPFSGGRVHDEGFGLVVALIIVGMLFRFECYAVAYELYSWADNWTTVASTHYHAYSTPMCAAMVFAYLLSGPLLTWLFSPRKR